MNVKERFPVSNLPNFADFKPEQVDSDLKSKLSAAEQRLNTQLATLATFNWDNLVAPIEQSQDEINQYWSPVSHLNSVANSGALRTAYEQGEQQLTEFYTRFGQNRQLYEAYLALSESPEFDTLSKAQQTTIEHSLRDFRLSGVALNEDDKRLFQKNQQRLSTLTTRFANNVLDATHGWHKHVTDEVELSGLPDHLIATAQESAKQKQLDGYVLTLDGPVFMTVMSQADNRQLRQDMYTAFTTRASDQGPTAGQWDNCALMVEILELRQQQAALLGFDNYAELSLAPKMASSSDEVLDFLYSLADKSRAAAEQELAELCEFTEHEYQQRDLQAWDLAYYSEKLKHARYQVSQESLRPYFPLSKVKDALFRVASTLFGIEIHQQDNIDTWHPDAEFYVISRNGETIAAFYLDLYTRQHKRGGAWMADCRVRRRTEHGMQLPVAYLVCNFNAPVASQTPLLTHIEVTTLFHEFGHGLHHMLTAIDVAAVSGISGVAWDAVELPSQFMENFCWDREVLGFLSGHHQTGEALPDEMLDNMLAAKNFQSAMQMLRQLEFAIFDMRLHKESSRPDFHGIHALIEEVRRDIAVINPPEFNRFENSFNHIFAGGYAAGYYSYKWAEVLSADAFAAFEEATGSVLNPDLGERFLQSILAKGGSEDAMTLFTEFRGRKPSIDALLRHSGLSA